MELSSLTSLEVLELIKLEVLKLKGIPTKVYTEKTGFESDNEVDAFELIEESRTRKYNNFFNTTKKISKIHKIAVSKIHNYNDMNDLKIIKKADKYIKVYEKNDTYIKYSNEISKSLENANDILEILKESDYIKLNITFFVNYTQKDLDNLEEGFFNVLVNNYKKAFIDSLFNKVQRSDNCVKDIHCKIAKNHESNQEFILLEVESLTQDEIDYSDMLKRFNNQN